MVADMVVALCPTPIVVDTCCPLGISKNTITANVKILGKLGNIKLAILNPPPKFVKIFNKKSIVKNRTHKANITADKLAIITANCVIIIPKNWSTLVPISLDTSSIFTFSSGVVGVGVDGGGVPVPPPPEPGVGTE